MVELPARYAADGFPASPLLTRSAPLIEEVEAIWSAIDRDDDWEPLARKLARIRRTGAFNATLGLMQGPNGRAGHVPIGEREPASAN